jgi:DNA polymerase V
MSEDCVQENDYEPAISFNLNEYLISNKPATFMFQVKGDSMMNCGILDGDKVIVDKSIQAKHDDIVIVAVNGDFTIKRLHKRNGKTELHPENEAYQPIIFSNAGELEVWGVVSGVIRKCRRG